MAGLRYLEEAAKVYEGYNSAIGELKTAVEKYNNQEKSKNPILEPLVNTFDKDIKNIISAANQAYQDNKDKPEAIQIIDGLTSDILLTIELLKRPDDESIRKQYIDRARKAPGAEDSKAWQIGKKLIYTAICMATFAAFIGLAVTVSPLFGIGAFVSGLIGASALDNLFNVNDLKHDYGLSKAMQVLVKDVEAQSTNRTKSGGVMSFFCRNEPQSKHDSYTSCQTTPSY